MSQSSKPQPTLRHDGDTFYYPLIHPTQHSENISPRQGVLCCAFPGYWGHLLLSIFCSLCVPQSHQMNLPKNDQFSYVTELTTPFPHWFLNQIKAWHLRPSMPLVFHTHTASSCLSPHSPLDCHSRPNATPQALAQA